MKRHLIKPAGLLCLLIPVFSYGLKNDKTQPANIISDNATYSKAGVNTYRGHVKITQGSTIITGDTVIVYNSSTGEKIKKMVVIGNLAHYSTILDHNHQSLNAQALKIEYYPPAGKIWLLGKGKISQQKNTFSGPHIEYDINQQVVISSPSKQNHTTIVIQSQPLP